MSRLACILVGLLPTAACMTTPGVEVLELASSDAVFPVGGFVTTPGLPIVVECHSPGEGPSKWEKAGETESDHQTNPLIGDAYAWNVEVSLPPSCWRPAEPSRSTSLVRARSLGDDKEVWLGVLDTTCAVEAVDAGLSPIEAGEKCASRRSYSRVMAPNDVPTDTDPLTDVVEVDPIILDGKVAGSEKGGYGYLDGVTGAEDSLSWSDVENDRFDFVTVTADNADWLGYAIGQDLPKPFHPAGNARDDLGREVRTGYAAKAVVQIEGTQVKWLATEWNGVPLNSPSDVVFHRNGTAFFTDPENGSDPRLGGVAPTQPRRGVYRIHEDGSLSLLDDQLDQPNGVALAPDQSWLYVSDRTANAVHRYPLDAEGFAIGPREWLAELPEPDGLDVDVNGNLYVAVDGGVAVLSPDGSAWGTIAFEGDVTDVTFCGPELRRLCVVGDGFVRRFAIPIPGTPPLFF